MEVRTDYPWKQMTDGFVSTDLSTLTKPPQIHTSQLQATLQETACAADESAIPLDIIPNIRDIASPDRILPLWHYFRAQRTGLSATGVDKGGAIAYPPGTATHTIESFLLRSQTHYQTAPDDAYFPDLHHRLYMASVYSLYTQEKLARQKTSRSLKRKRATAIDEPIAANKSWNDTFIDLLLPQLQRKDGTRRQAKNRFENWRALGSICAKLIEHFGEAILLLLPSDLSNEK